MLNKFFVSGYRFHVYNKRILLIKGEFRNNDKGNEKLFVTLDDKKVQVKVEEHELPIPITQNDNLLTKQYYLWIKLPENWKEMKKLRIVQCGSGKKKIIRTFSIRTICKLYREIPHNIDQMRVIDQGIRIKGWYIDTGDTRLEFEKHNKPIKAELHQVRRVDVVNAFPECKKENAIGFEAILSCNKTDVVKVKFSSPDRDDFSKVYMDENSIFNKISQTGELLKKTNNTFHQYGIAKTLEKVQRKLLKKDHIPYEGWLKLRTPKKGELARQANEKFSYMPKISIVVPLYKTQKKYLDKLIASVMAQTYANWELCLSDGSGSDSPIEGILKAYEKKDSRIKVVYNHKPLQISENTNAALDIATGDFIAFSDHDDLLTPDALYECVKAINLNPDVEMIYTDEDKISMNGKEHFEPHFKTDFNIDMLRSVNYICHLCVVKRSLYEKVGKLNPEYDGAQDYDFVLRCVEQTKNIVHIPKILYHWRAHKDSTAENPESKNYAFEAGKRAIEAHLKRLGISAEVTSRAEKGFYRVKYELQDKPLVSVIIPTKDHIEDLDKCLQSLEKVNTYDNMEYIIVENNSEKEETFEYYDRIQKEIPKAKVVYWKDKGFNYPSINNMGVDESKGKYLLFLNNDTEIVNPDCISEMLSQCQRSEVGAVGARLYYEDGTIQHAGVIIGMGGVAGHAFVGFEHDDLGYFARIVLTQDYSAVTAACMMVKRDVFEEVGRFDEKYAVAFNDIDLCLKIREAGYLIVYDPYAELNHYESKSRGYEDTEEKVARFNSEVDRFQKRWKDVLQKGDPYYSPNLTLDKNDFSLTVDVR